METFYGISITHFLYSKHTACQKYDGGEAGGCREKRETNLQKQEGTDKWIHLRFTPCFQSFSFNFPWLFKLANTLIRKENTWGKQKPNKQKNAVQISVTCTIALISSLCLNIWMNCGLFFITPHLERLLALFSNFWSFWLDDDCFVVGCHIVQNESWCSHHPRKNNLENERLCWKSSW